jgi:hypothetical protein
MLNKVRPSAYALGSLDQARKFKMTRKAVTTDSQSGECDSNGDNEINSSSSDTAPNFQSRTAHTSKYKAALAASVWIYFLHMPAPNSPLLIES